MRGQISARVMLHPLLVVALGLLVINDHFLKQAHPSWATGKLSDFAGLIVFPLLILSVLDFAVGLSGRNGRTIATTILVASAVVFVAIQIIPVAADGYREVMGLLQYPFRAMAGATSATPVRHIADPSDLLALPALLAAWMVARHAFDAISDVPRPNPIGT